MHQKIIEALKELGIEQPTTATGPITHIMSHELRIPGGYFGLSPHQDWSSGQGSLDSLTTWVPLVDVTADLFPLELIPESHLKGLWAQEGNGLYKEIPTNTYKDSDFLKIEAEQGDVVFMSGFTVHRSGQGKEGVRIACSIRYDNAAEETYIERNYPCTYRRTLDQKVLFENFPNPQQLQKVFG